eukprot:TRINITY_DN56005_c0_g1_i1.p1 TRINITY_DN56005_c0_g1~~TRINITY_DN56005_c0_g1_i1.p1  ORF type:complete len:103 (-),score=2.00 TRINITY_DN56005_c0_g1_i1:197-505(-)
MSRLRIPRGFYTPGLWGGGTVHHFHTHQNIELLMWQLRLDSQSALKHYLQEVGAELSLVSVSIASRQANGLVSKYFDVLLNLDTILLRSPTRPSLASFPVAL